MSMSDPQCAPKQQPDQPPQQQKPQKPQMQPPPPPSQYYTFQGQMSLQYGQPSYVRPPPPPPQPQYVYPLYPNVYYNNQTQASNPPPPPPQHAAMSQTSSVRSSPQPNPRLSGSGSVSVPSSNRSSATSRSISEDTQQPVGYFNPVYNPYYKQYPRQVDVGYYQQGRQASASSSTASSTVLPTPVGYTGFETHPQLQRRDDASKAPPGFPAGLPMYAQAKQVRGRSKQVQDAGTPHGEASKPYRCTLCQWSFVRHSDLRRHLRSHNAPEYHCPYWHPEYATCPHRNQGSFNRLDVLKRHLRLVHFDVLAKDGSPEGLVKRQDAGTCLACGRFFSNSKLFIDHVDECARTTPMEGWKYKKNGVITNVKKDPGSPAAPPSFVHSLPPVAPVHTPPVAKPEAESGDDKDNAAGTTTPATTATTEYEGDTELPQKRVLADEYAAGVKKEKLDAGHGYLKRRRGRPRKYAEDAAEEDTS